jgi:hypothetical protein
MADYPISNVPRRVQYVNSGVGPYAFTFEVLVQTDIAVYRGSTLLTLTTDYTVTINANGTGSVTLVTAGTGNITIVGARAIQRSSDYTTGGDLFASTLNTDLDSQTIYSQQLAETLDRTIKVPVTDASTLNMQLPSSTARANKVFAFDSNGAPQVSTNTVAAIDAAVDTIESIASAPAGNSAGISHIASGSGAVATTVQAKLRESVNVKDFGAVGDGVTDDSAAIALANTAAGKQPLLFQGTFYVPTATTITAPIVDTMAQIFTTTSVVTINNGQPVRPEWWGARADNSTLCVTAFAKAQSALVDNGTMLLGSGVYRGWIESRRSNWTIRGQGSSSTVIKLPNNASVLVRSENEARFNLPPTLVGVPNVIDIGQTSEGNYAVNWNNVTVSGVTVDGNYQNIPEFFGVENDVFGYGISTSHCYRAYLYDCRAQNCWLSGFSAFMQTDFYRAEKLYAFKCGMVTDPPLYAGGFRGDQIQYSSVDITSEQCGYGMYIAGGWIGNYLNLIVKQTTRGAFQGFGRTGQPFSNNTVIINGDCNGGGGVSLGNSEPRSMEFNTFVINLRNSSNVGLITSEGVNFNNFQTSFFNCGAGAIGDVVGDHNTIYVTSKDNGQGGDTSQFDCTVSGNYNTVYFDMIGPDAPAAALIRGLRVLSGATGNKIRSFHAINPVSFVQDFGTKTSWNFGDGIGTAINAGDPVSYDGTTIPVNGVANITSLAVTATNRRVTLLFTGTAAGTGLTNGGNLKLASNFVYTPNDTITLQCDDTNWYEISRSINS